MPRITAISFKKGRDPRAAVEVDGAPWREIDAEVAVEAGLAEGLQLGLENLEEIARRSEESRAWRRLRAYLSGRLRTARQVERYLRRFELSEDQAARLVERATERGLIDDERYAGAYVRSRKRIKLVGPRRLRAELTRDGVAGDLAREAVDEHRGRDFQGLTGHDEETQQSDEAVQEAECLKLLQRRRRQLEREPDPRKRWQKALRYLLGRGYDSRPANAAVRRHLGSGPDAEVDRFET